MPTFHSIQSPTRNAVLTREARVVDLFGSRGPSNIVRFVVAVVVDVIQCQVRRWLGSDVLIKGDKTIAPSVTYLNTSAAVVSVGVAVWIVATLDDRAPQLVLNAFAQPVFPMLLLIPASAGRGCSDAKAPYKHFACNPARATTKEVAQRPSPCGLGDNGPSADDSS